MSCLLIASLGRNNELGYKGKLWHRDRADFVHFSDTIADRNIVTGKQTAKLMRGRAFLLARHCYVYTRGNAGIGDYRPIGEEGLENLHMPIIAGAYNLLAGYCQSAIITRWPASLTGPADIWFDPAEHGFELICQQLHESKNFTLEQWSKINANLDD